MRNYPLLRFHKGLEKLVGINIGYGFDPVYEAILQIEWNNGQFNICFAHHLLVIIPGNFFKQKSFFLFGGNDEEVSG